MAEPSAMRGALESDSIVVTGMGAVTPLGHGTERLFAGWKAGESGLCDGRGACDEFDPAAHLTKREVRNLDRHSQLGMVAAAEAVGVAGWLESPPCDPDRIACVIGTAFGGMSTLESEIDTFRVGGPTKLSPRAYTKAMANALPASLSIKYGWRGETFSLGSGCASGLQAVIAGMRMLETSIVDAVVVGGADGCVTEYSLAGYAALGATSSSGSCRPYDRSRDGIVPAEGAGVLLLERRAAATLRGAEPLVTLCGSAVTSDAHNIATPDPAADGLVRALRGALDDAAVTPDHIDYLNTHGSGSVLGDRIEAEAVGIALGTSAAAIPISSTKSVIGHTQGAAGAIELIATAQALRLATAPPTRGLEEPDVGSGLTLVQGAPMPLVDRSGKGGLMGLSLSFGLGGHNAAAVLGVPAADWAGGAPNA